MQNKRNNKPFLAVMLLLFLFGGIGYALYLIKSWKLIGVIGLLMLGAGFLMLFINSVRRIKQINAEKENRSADDR